MPAAFAEFIHLLAQAVPPRHCINPYGYQRPFAQQRRENLHNYLQLMAQQQPNLLLIGEAPGYRGCRLTGIPFVSPSILAEIMSQFPQSNKQAPCPGEWPHIQKEASATIVWRTVGQWRPLPLLWNIFPFHPHQPDKPQSNRPPAVREIEMGRPYLTALMQLFPQTQLVAVGKKAAAGLTKWGYVHTAVRHPSHGGAKLFQTALDQLR